MVKETRRAVRARGCEKPGRGSLLCKRIALCAFCLLASMLQAVETNWWQTAGGVYGGSWGDVAHWSLGHVPTGSEMAVIDPTRDNTTAADFEIAIDSAYEAFALIVGDPFNVKRNINVTFTGTGSLTCCGNLQNVFRYCRAITFAGPSFTFTFTGSKLSLLNYAPVTVKNGSTIYSESTLTFWKNNDYLTVGAGGKVDVAGVDYYNGGNRTLTVDAGGTFVCRGNYAPYVGTETETRTFGLVVNGGDVQIAGTLKLTRPSASVQMKAGTLYLGKTPSVCDMSQFQIAGGTLRYGFNVLQDSSDPYYALAQGRFGGCGVFLATNGVTFTSHEPFHVSQLNIGDSANPARIDCDTLVFDANNWPFKWTHNGNRNLHLYGPTAIYANGKDLSNGFNNHYIHSHGKITVHTEDWSDATVKRTVAIRGLVSEDGSLDLVATGGGTFKFGQCYSYETMRSFTVEEGTALQLGNRDAKIGDSTEWGPLVAETLTLEKNVTVAFTAGEQHIAASTWSIDPSVRITVTIPTTYTSQKVAFTPGGYPILMDLDSKALPDSLLSQITLTGATEGWELVNEYGQISVVKLDTSLLGTFGAFEWLGGSGNNWSTAANWNGGTPAEMQTHCFGVSANRHVVFDCASAGTKQTTLGSIEFKECAGRSFFIDKGMQITFNASPSVKSYSHVPQLIAAGHREIGDRIIASYAGGAIVFPQKTYDGTQDAYEWTGNNHYVKFIGDIRMGCGSSGVRAVYSGENNRTHFPSWRSCLTVIDGGYLNLTNQDANLPYVNTSFRVSRGGTMSFASGGAFYKWTAAPASIVVDGALTIGPKLYGGCNQVYRGSGTLNVNGGDLPFSASSRVKFADALTVNLASDWQTAVSGSASLALALGVTAGAPTLRVPASWTYGAASGVTPASTAEARAFALENGATAILDPQGGTATLNETVSGEGTLAITNGTLVLNAASTADGATVAVSKGATLRINAAQSLAGLSLATGATVTVSAAVTLDCLAAAGATVDLGADQTLVLSGDVNVQDVAFDFDATGGRRTLLRTTGAVTGTPANAGFYRYRTKVEGGATLLQVSNAGLMILFR